VSRLFTVLACYRLFQHHSLPALCRVDGDNNNDATIVTESYTLIIFGLVIV
jgi:hypothetical protein